ncbi:MAG TPA: putative quinol monooxygenase [Burkholderiaceae bacterium]|nr:putative quinol monooxygenase [Burkholderiaceae bacterium]
MTIHVLATAQAREDTIDEVRALLQPLVEPIRNDPGCLRCDFVINTENPAEMVFIEVWKDEAALERHLADPQIVQGVEAVSPLLAQPLSLKRHQPA